MILRNVGRSVRNHDWLAVGVEVVIVVIGVFIGIQVSNWNEARLDREREAVLLRELQDEASRNTRAGMSVGEGLAVGADAARRVLSAVEAGGAWCAEDCWPTVVDLMHASQWQRMSGRWTTYDELRRAGLPSDRRIIEAVEALLQNNHRAGQALEFPPEYRSLVRGRIPVGLQDAYWSTCFQEADSFEYYLDPCPRPAGTPPVPPLVVDEIMEDPRLIPALREWTGLARLAGVSLTTLQPRLSAQIDSAIDAALRAP